MSPWQDGNLQVNHKFFLLKTTKMNNNKSSEVGVKGTGKIIVAGSVQY